MRIVNFADDRSGLISRSSKGMFLLAPVPLQIVRRNPPLLLLWQLPRPTNALVMRPLDLLVRRPAKTK